MMNLYKIFLSICRSIFQVICVLGYALGPLAIAVTIFELMSLLGVLSGTFFVRLMISAAAAGWSSVGEFNSKNLN